METRAPQREPEPAPVSPPASFAPEVEPLTRSEDAHDFFAENPPLNIEDLGRTRPPEFFPEPPPEKPAPTPEPAKTGNTQPFTIELETAKYLRQMGFGGEDGAPTETGEASPLEPPRQSEPLNAAFFREMETAKYFNQRPAAAQKSIDPLDLTLPVHPMYFTAYGANKLVEGNFRVYLNGRDLLFVCYSGVADETTTKKMMQTFEAIGRLGGKSKGSTESESAKRLQMLDAADEMLIREICEKEIEGSFLANAREFTHVEIVPPKFWSNLIVGGRKYVGVMTMTHESGKKLIFQIPGKDEMMTINAIFPTLFGEKAKLDFSWRNKN